MHPIRPPLSSQQLYILYIREASYKQQYLERLGCAAPGHFIPSSYLNHLAAAVCIILGSFAAAEGAARYGRPYVCAPRP